MDEEGWGGVNTETFYRVRVGSPTFTICGPYYELDHVRDAFVVSRVLRQAKKRGTFIQVEKVVRRYQEHVTPVEL